MAECWGSTPTGCSGFRSGRPRRGGPRALPRPPRGDDATGGAGDNLDSYLVRPDGRDLGTGQLRPGPRRRRADRLAAPGHRVHRPQGARSRRCDREQQLAAAQSIAHDRQLGVGRPDQTVTWSDELYRIFDVEPGPGRPTTRFLDRMHPEDRGRVAASSRARRSRRVLLRRPDHRPGRRGALGPGPRPSPTAAPTAPRW